MSYDSNDEYKPLSRLLSQNDSHSYYVDSSYDTESCSNQGAQPNLLAEPLPNILSSSCPKLQVEMDYDPDSLSDSVFVYVHLALELEEDEPDCWVMPDRL